ncbi:DNA internalization-related competence protein ComEC/Rec2 [Cupriavidus pauculus]|uniref:DNA internalization-related competence protein ComEC/Rec2 n=1 Tax=Cupriavidus pauculus TaxID=82633 RepID=UPI001EE1852D|nr:DNA internalization-related competence protein ComEC/Rec2 [Cupriavidus pauculus]GJG93157.1 DNA internalization-related competence protein ComEC/Rec2 [Cupriavidus pauculus]
MRLVLLAFVAGGWLLQQQAALPDRAQWLGACGVALACAAALLGRWQRARVGAPAALGAAIALAALVGFGWSAWRADTRLERWLPPEMAGRDLVVDGIVAGLPDQGPQGSRFLFRIERWHGDAAALSSSETLLLTWRDPASNALQPGQRYRLTVRLRRPRGLANPHGFDYAYWLLAEGVHATGHVRVGTRLDDAGPLPWSVRVAMWRAAIRDHLRAALPADARYGPVLIALVIGDQRGIAQADWEIFRRTGISHLVSISGLHITMIAGAAGALMRVLWRHSFGLARVLRRPLPLWWPAQQAGLVVTVLAALGYGLIAGMQIPALRTVTMLVVAAMALWSARAPPVSVMLAWAAGVAVAIDPWAVLQPGFWLSFGAVAVIFLHAQDDSIDTQPGVRPATPGWLARLRDGLCDAARAQWAVTIGLVPLTLLLFGQVSVVSCVANAVAIPVVSLLVTPLALAGAALPVALAAPVLELAHAVLSWLAGGLTWLAAPRWAVWEAAHPGWWRTVLAIAGVWLLLVPRRPAWLRSARRVPRWAGVALMVPMLMAGRAPVADGEIRMTALDVGKGTAVLVETRRHALLYDAGPAYISGTSAGGQVIVPFLRAVGVRGLDMLMVSHEDADHAGGVRDVMHAVPVAARLTAASGEHRLLAGQRWDACVAGDGWEWDGVRFDVLHPSEEDLQAGHLSSNARSCVLRVATAQRSVLLTGDIGVREEMVLIGRVPADQLRADVLLVPHHGSGTSSHVTFLRAVRPELAIFQLGFANRYRHPRADVWRRYERADVDRYRTDETGAVAVETAGDALAVTPFRQRNRRYWRDAPPAPI